MLSLNLIREHTSMEGTEGVLQTPSQLFFTLELPWFDNKQNISCIPVGEYICTLAYSNRFRRKTYLLHDVPNRSWVRIHRGNYAGSEAHGFKTNVEGCILLGTKRGIIGGQTAVLSSKVAMIRFLRELNGAAFVLNIHENY